MKRFLIKLIRWYQRNISAKRAPCCRFSPSCSAYAIKAIEVHGAFKGTLLSIYRVLRCSPLTPGGYDPVPEKGRWTNDIKRYRTPSTKKKKK